MNKKASKSISICIDDPIKVIFLSIAIFIAIPLTNALLVAEPIIAAVIDFGLMIYLAINLMCALIIVS